MAVTLNKPLRRPLFAGTEWEVPFAKFRKKKVAVVCLFLLAFMYLGIPFEGFIAPYGENSLDKNKSWHPPHRINLVHEGKFIGPFVYEYELGDKVFKKYRLDKSTVHPLGLFVKGDPYTLLFFIKTDIHLFGTTTGGRFYLLGADESGRDLFSRMVYGAKVSLTIGFVTVMLALFGAILVGGLSGMYGGVVDWIIMRICEAITLMPVFYLFMYLRSVLPAGLNAGQKFMIITLIFAVPAFAAGARGIRNWVLSLKHADFATSALLSGESRLRVLFRHILPQIRGLLILDITLAVPGVILSEAGLSFLNLGITEPSVSWGMLMNSAGDINTLYNYTWILWPALIIILTVFCFFVLGFAIKDSLDPKAGLDVLGRARQKRRKSAQTARAAALAQAAPQALAPNTLVELRQLSIDFHLPSGTVRAVENLDLSIMSGEILGLAGESGCGKSVTLQAMIGMVQPPGKVAPEASVLLGQGFTHAGEDFLSLPEKAMATTRNQDFGLIMQEPSASFNPLFRIGKQLIQTACACNRNLDRAEAERNAIRVLTELGIKNAAARLNDYPFQFSGGMLQRAMIAMAMINQPRILLADEPTTALDPTTQVQILKLIKDERDKTGMAVVFVTHDLVLLSGFADRIAVMYAGHLVELAPTSLLMSEPRHPYTRDLLASIPRYGSFKSDKPLYAIPGKVPSPAERPAGCPYHTRCALCFERCKVEFPPLQELGSGRQSRCWLAASFSGQGVSA